MDVGLLLFFCAVRMDRRNADSSGWVDRAIHRGDYQYVGTMCWRKVDGLTSASRNVLLQEATRSGAQILTNAEVVDVKSAEDVESGRKVHLKDGRRIDADVVVGADGLWSFVLVMSSF